MAAKKRRVAAPRRGVHAEDASFCARGQAPLVDDDIRNIYSLTSVLESYDVEVLHAERGKDGILILEQTPGIHVALIDIMMPDMDGYETMQQIRQQPQLAEVPLIAVTAKAMKGDRQKCLDAGASDYIAKPVDIEQLPALLRVWIDPVARMVGADLPTRRPNDGAPSPSRILGRPPDTGGPRRRRAVLSSTTTTATCSRSGRSSRTSPKSRSPPRARRRCVTCSRASSP